MDSLTGAQGLIPGSRRTPELPSRAMRPKFSISFAPPKSEGRGRPGARYARGPSRVGSRGGGRHVFRVEFGDPGAPHADELIRCHLVHRFPLALECWKRIAPDRAFAPSLALLLAFARGAHRFPREAIGLADVLGGAFPALLMDQVEIAEVRLAVRDPLEQDAFGDDLVGGRNGVVPGIANLPKAEFAELIFAQLEQADIRPCALIGVETGFDFGNRFHEVGIETESVGSALDLVDRRSDRD